MKIYDQHERTQKYKRASARRRCSRRLRRTFKSRKVRELNGERKGRRRGRGYEGGGRKRGRVEKPIIRENTAGCHPQNSARRRSDGDSSSLFYSFPSWRLLREKLHRRLGIFTTNLFNGRGTIYGRSRRPLKFAPISPIISRYDDSSRRVSFYVSDNPRGLCWFCDKSNRGTKCHATVSVYQSHSNNIAVCVRFFYLLRKITTYRGDCTGIFHGG